MACVLGMRLSNYLTEALSLTDIPKYFRTNSTTALFWLKKNDQQGTFVGNRVREICSVTKLQESKNTLFSLVHGESFPESGNSVNGILVERDQRSLLRVETKIIERDDDYSFRYSILLPSKHHVVDCLIREYNLIHSHAGIHSLIAIIREEFWIIAARRTIRSVVKKCVRCKRFTAKPPTTFPIQLPLDRVRDAARFEVTGIDLCGPLILRSKTKAWVVLFTCAVYRCVHLEVVTSINTEYFIQALRRFIARRGRPSVIFSDNGTNFTGTSTVLRKGDWERWFLRKR
ncbi:hypothetical protein AVEN_29109-1 [Araneus ventricosus]|uniref:Integrase zinc-binding domain-containing protein n=1 Tax=Araneus ventricosus TaxID=182803 RepID=A0A4Y2ALL7_ARAVE|nr:hypothetical protein AVEN_29109-1 [Araneus ventricosus]